MRDYQPETRIEKALELAWQGFANNIRFFLSRVATPADYLE